MANFYTRFLQAVQQFPAHVAFQMQRENGDLETYTFSDTRKMADSVAAWLESSGINRGARCAILANNSPRWVAVYLGIVASGRVAVPFDTAFNAEQVAKLLKDSGAELLVTDATHVATSKSALEKFPCRLVRSTNRKTRPNWLRSTPFCPRLSPIRFQWSTSAQARPPASSIPRGQQATPRA